jgi:hypothetical protein
MINRENKLCIKKTVTQFKFNRPINVIKIND